MKLPIPIDTLLHGKAVEWERLEFKSGWNPLDVLHTLCAFANDFHNLGGGYIVVGVAEDDGRPVLPPSGIETSQLNAIQKEILNLGHKRSKIIQGNIPGASNQAGFGRNDHPRKAQ